MKLHVSLKKDGVEHGETPKSLQGIALSFYHRKARADLVLHQANKLRTKVRTGRATLNIDDACFYLVRDRRNVRMFPRGERPGSINSRCKRHVPKLIVGGIQ